tara:strand:- start:248 stop:376 length:129 start_codon:yes stop_codon:yes gene_type:complete
VVLNGGLLVVEVEVTVRLLIQHLEVVVDLDGTVLQYLVPLME